MSNSRWVPLVIIYMVLLIRITIALNTVPSSNKPAPSLIKESTLSQQDRYILGAPMDINRATLGDLTIIPGIGRLTALKIIQHRTKLGSYQTLDQLAEIKGISTRKLRHLSQHLCVQDKF